MGKPPRTCLYEDRREQPAPHTHAVRGPRDQGARILQYRVLHRGRSIPLRQRPTALRRQLANPPTSSTQRGESYGADRTPHHKPRRLLDAGLHRHEARHRGANEPTQSPRSEPARKHCDRSCPHAQPDRTRRPSPTARHRFATRGLQPSDQRPQTGP